MLKQRHGNRGFTLPEVLVTVAIVAVLAAVVVPAVTQQIGKADAPTLKTSVNSLRTAITSFVTDVRAFPGQTDHLQTVIATTDFTLDPLGTGATSPDYTQAQVDRWRGPYDNSGAINGTISLGADWQTTNVLLDSLDYLVVVLTKAAGAKVVDAQALDDLIDDGVGTTGIVRWEAAVAPVTDLDPADQVRLFLMSSRK